MRFIFWILRVIGGFFICLFLIVGLLSMLAPSEKPPQVPDGAALVVDPHGLLVEEMSGNPVDRAMNRLFGEQPLETPLRDLTKAIRDAGKDQRIKALVLRTDDLAGGGLADLQAIGEAVAAFKRSGKPVIAQSDGFTQSQYYLAAMADEVEMNPDGLVFLQGYGVYRNYFKDLLDKLKVDWNVFRVGEYKSYVEPYTRNDMSPAAREADKAWLGTLWDAYQDDVTRARQLPDNALDDYIGHLVSNLKAHDGDTAKLALDAGLVDKLANRDEMRSRLIEVVGEDSDTHSFKQIDFHDYLKSVKAQGKFEHYSANKIGVIVASGTIVNGDQPPGGIGGDSTAELIRRARFDKSIKAIVLRVDSGGGSAFASEIIRHELELTRKAGKPVIVSMGSVAASGGYWISMAGDEIFARPTTITGSIGILGMFPTFQRTLEWAGVHNDGVGTTPLSGALRPDRAMTPEMKQAFQMAIDHGYQEFIHHVAAAREMPVAEVDKIARGRVWSGLDAERLGLVDKLGGFDDAVKAAADKAGVGDDYQLKYVRKPLTPRQQFLLNLLNGSHALVGSVQAPPKPDLPYAQLQRTLARQVKLLSQLNDPRGVYAYCFCRTN